MSGAVPLEDVLATTQLPLRPRIAKDATLQAQALRAIATARVDGRAAVLAALTEQARLLCCAHSAGVSLFTSRKLDQLTWASVCGILAPFEGNRFPLRHSMCGICLERREPQLFFHPHTYFNWMALNGMHMKDVLVAPLCGIGNDVYGTLWVAAHDATAAFNLADRDVLLVLGEHATAAVRSIAGTAQP